MQLLSLQNPVIAQQQVPAKKMGVQKKKQNTANSTFISTGVKSASKKPEMLVETQSRHSWWNFGVEGTLKMSRLPHLAYTRFAVFWHELFSHTIPTYPSSSREKLMGKKKKSPKATMLRTQNPCTNPTKPFLATFKKCNRQIFVYPSVFSKKCC